MSSHFAVRATFAALVLAIAAPAIAYILPTAAIVRRLAQRREDLAIQSLEVRATLQLTGDLGTRAATILNVPGGATVSASIILTMKAPGRCKIESATPASTPSETPAIISKNGALTGRASLDTLAPLAAMLNHLCALLGDRPNNAIVQQSYTKLLTRTAAAIDVVALGRAQGRVAYVIGARPFDPPRPQLWIDKLSFQPVRFVAPYQQALYEVRLVNWGSAIGGDWFPRAVEVFQGEQRVALLSTDKVVVNPKIADQAF